MPNWKWLKKFKDKQNRNKHFQIWPFHGGFGIELAKDHLLLKFYIVAFFYQFKAGQEIDWFSDGPATFKFMFLEDMLNVEIARWNYKKCFWMPWGLEHLKWEVIGTRDFKVAYRNQKKKGMKSDDWTRAYDLEREMALLNSCAYRFKYDLSRHDGPERNELLVLAHLRKGTWYYRGLPFIRRSHMTVEIEFNDEFGSRKGSWKGGTLACGVRTEIGEFHLFDEMVDTALRYLCEEDKHSSFVSCEEVDMREWFNHLEARNRRWNEQKRHETVDIACSEILNELEKK